VHVNPNDDFNPLAKVFYRPVEAAIRWCNLMAYESQILEAEWNNPELLPLTFPQWPCLPANTEKIFDAVLNHELPYGIFGSPATSEKPLDRRLLTVRHIDLKWWMSHYYPDQRPAFLFGGFSAESQKISIGTYLILKADRDALEIELNTIKSAYRELTEQLKTIGIERENLRTLAQKQGRFSERSELGYQRVLGALIETLLGFSPSGKPNSVFGSQAAIVDSITAHYEGVAGLSKRTLDEKFANARRSLLRP
jgi:hypothetical protein